MSLFPRKSQHQVYIFSENKELVNIHVYGLFLKKKIYIYIYIYIIYICITAVIVQNKIYFKSGLKLDSSSFLDSLWNLTDFQNLCLCCESNICFIKKIFVGNNSVSNRHLLSAFIHLNRKPFLHLRFLSHQPC